jgi:hypothetical protein
MDRQLAWAAGHPTAEDEMLSYPSDTAAYHGKNDKARELSGRAIDLATGDGREGNRGAVADGSRSRRIRDREQLGVSSTGVGSPRLVLLARSANRR